MAYNSDTMSYDRILQLPDNHSFFLFGARGTGKSTLLDEWRQSCLAGSASTQLLMIDLLDPETEARYARNPGLLRQEIEQCAGKLKWCVIDEVQKIPQLLDVAHWAIQKMKVNFALTGSSARKLKGGRANLLAGRAFDFRLYPLTRSELGDDFNLIDVLRYGSLPEIFHLKSELSKRRFLDAYTRTYLKEEIQLEQIVRNVQRFRQFLSFAAQMNTKILSFSKLARASGVDEKSVGRYFEILEDTLVGIFLEPYERSVRKRQKAKPKFYLFDTGVACQMREDFSGELKPGSALFGELFEQWFILECHRLSDYLENGDRFFYLATKENAEIDLIIERKGMHPVLIEIKSSDMVTDEHTRHLKAFMKSMKFSRAIVVSREKRARRTADGIEILPFDVALDELYPKLF